MKTALIYTIIGLLAINLLTAQVKIGDNPQNLNPASLLELESTSRALVISRVTDAQMSAISPLRGALVYNTDQNCLHYYDGTAWINICEALDDSFTVSTRDDYMSQLYSNTLDSTVVITTTDNGDGSTNYNFEVGEITGSNIQDFSIEGRDIVNRTIAGDKIASRSVNPLRIFNDGDDLTRQVLLWNGNVAPDGEWQRISESDLQISEADGVIGNEVVGPFDTTLRLEGSGDEIDPYTLDVSEGGITDFEIATGAVTSDEILNGTILDEDIANDAVTNEKIDASVVGTGLVQNASGALEVDATQINGDGTLSSTNNTITFTGTPTNALLEDVGIDVADDAITSAKIAPGAVESTDIAADAVNAATINNDVAGNGLVQNASGALEVDAAQINGDGTLSSTNNTITFTGTPTNALLEDVGIDVADDAITSAKIAPGAVESTDIAADAVNAATINVDVAGNGLDQNVGGALDVNVDGLTIEIDPTDGLQIIDEGVTVNKIAPGANGQVLTTVAGATSWQNTLSSIVVATGQVTANPGPNPGEYTISNPSITTTSIIQLTVEETVSGNPIMIQLADQNNGGFSVKIFEFQPDPTLINANWQYIVVEP